MQQKLPELDQQQRTLDQLKQNLRNVIDTGKVLSAAIKKMEQDIELRHRVK